MKTVNVTFQVDDDATKEEIEFILNQHFVKPQIQSGVATYRGDGL